jgi:antirestriction protein ArdC
MLWSAAIEKGYTAPIWMTFKQALELKAHVRKGEQGSLVVHANKIIRTETDQATGEESEHAIPFMKGYTVFNVEQIEGLPEHYHGNPEVRTDSVQCIAHAEVSALHPRSPGCPRYRTLRQQRLELQASPSSVATVSADHRRPDAPQT